MTDKKSHMPKDFEEARHAGMGFAAKMALERKYGDAKKILNLLLGAEPNDTELLTMLSGIYIAEEDYDGAKAWLNNALAIEPNYPRALYNLGVVCQKTGKHKKAVKNYENAIKNYSEHEMDNIADAYQNLGCSLWELGQENEAIEAWKTCLEYDPNQKCAKRNLKEFMNEYGQPKSHRGLDDVFAFSDMKHREYLSANGKEEFDDLKEANKAMDKIMKAWNGQIAPKYGRKLDHMRTGEKLKLFENTKVFA